MMPNDNSEKLQFEQTILQKNKVNAGSKKN